MIMANEELKNSRLIYYAESAALIAFGIAWLIAGAYQMVDDLQARFG